MPKAQISVDTDQKTVSVIIDGQIVNNVSDFCFYADKDNNGNYTYMDLDFSSYERSDNNVLKKTSYFLSASEKANQAIASGKEIVEVLDGFVGVVDDYEDVKNDIVEFFS